MNCKADIFRIGTHFQRQNCLCYQLTGVGADDPGAEYALVFLIEKYLGQTFIAIQSSDRPLAAQGKAPFSYSIPCALASVSLKPIHATSGSV